MSKLGRKSVFEDKFSVVDNLTEFDQTKLSRYLKEQLVEKGFLKTETVKLTGAGRPKIVYVLTGKARSYVALSKNWKRA